MSQTNGVTLLNVLRKQRDVLKKTMLMCWKKRSQYGCWKKGTYDVRPKRSHYAEWQLWLNISLCWWQILLNISLCWMTILTKLMTILTNHLTMLTCNMHLMILSTINTLAILEIRNQHLVFWWSRHSLKHHILLVIVSVLIPVSHTDPLVRSDYSSWYKHTETYLILSVCLYE
jgi:hypothetical protein